MTQQNQNLIDHAYRPDDIVDAYAKWVEQHVHNGWDATLLTFMFNPIAGSPSTRMTTMTATVESIYARVLTRMYRVPNAPKHQGHLPVWIVAPDRPVPKRGFIRDHLFNIRLNDGDHSHALTLSEPHSRLGQPLADFLMDNEHHFAGRARTLQRLHALNIDHDPGYVTRYVLKGVTRHRIDAGDVFVLPRVRSELGGR